MMRKPPEKEPGNPRDFNDPRNNPRYADRDEANNSGRSDRPFERRERTEKDRPARSERTERTDRSDRSTRPDRPDWAYRPERSDRPSDRPARGDRPDRSERSDRPARFERSDRPARRDFGGRPNRDDRGDRPRPPRGAGLLAELRELDYELIGLIARRSRMLTRLPNSGTSEHERELRTSWESNAASVSRDPKLIRQLFALLQEIEVNPGNLDQPNAFNLAPARKPVIIDIPLPPSDRPARLMMALATCSGGEGVLHDVPLNDPVLECLKGLNQIGASLRWEDDGRILCRKGESAVPTHARSLLDKVVHVGDDPLNLYLVLFQMVTRPARLKIIGESDLKFVDLVSLRHFFPVLGARLTSVVPGQEGLPARLEASALLPEEVRIPADLPADAVLALLMATPAWDREVTIHLSEHPHGPRIAAEALPLLRAAKVAVTHLDTPLSLRIIPGEVTPCSTPSMNCAAVSVLMSMPAFFGGRVCLCGEWKALSEFQCNTHYLDTLLALLASAGVTVSRSDDSITATIEDIENIAPVPALTDLSELSPELLPFGLVLALIPVVRAKGGMLPKLPEGIDLSLIDSFLGQLGLTSIDGTSLVPVEPTSAPWASPTTEWALALSLAAFLRPHIKLGNPGIVQSQIPRFWALYNSLPVPSLSRNPGEAPDVSEVSTDTSVARPIRRRVMASYTPESEMPDELVYVDEDE